MAIVAKNRHLNAAPPESSPAVRPATAGSTQSLSRYADLKVRARIRRPMVQPTATVGSAQISVEPAPQPQAATVPASQPKHNYEIGYRKPPRHTQFKKGRSGNPKGRPRGAKGLQTLARQMLTEKVTVRTAAGDVRMSKMEAMLHKIMEKAFSGDMRALQVLLQLYAASVPEDPLALVLPQGPVLDMDAHDQAILDALRQTLRDEGEKG